MPAKGTPMMGRAEWAMLLGLSLLWGGSFLFNGILVQLLPPLTIVAGRVGIAAVTLWVVLGVMSIPAPRGSQLWVALFGMGLLNNVLPFTLIVWGQTHIAAGLAAIFNATTPLFTVVLAHVLTDDEKLTPSRGLGVLLGLGGVVVLIGPDVLQGLGQDVLSQLAVVCAAVSYACAGIFGRRFRAYGINPIAAATGQVTASTILLAPVALLLDRPWHLGPLPPQAWLALAGLGVVSTALAYILYFRILARAGATNVLLVTMLIPVSAVVLGALVLHEHLEAGQVLGMGLIALGVLAIDGRLTRGLSIQVVVPSR
ncbi:MAG: DMT family transporter [Thermomicrobiales bacterium]